MHLWLIPRALDLYPNLLESIASCVVICVDSLVRVFTREYLFTFRKFNVSVRRALADVGQVLAVQFCMEPRGRVVCACWWYLLTHASNDNRFELLFQRVQRECCHNLYVWLWYGVDVGSNNYLLHVWWWQDEWILTVGMFLCVTTTVYSYFVFGAGNRPGWVARAFFACRTWLHWHVFGCDNVQRRAYRTPGRWCVNVNALAIYMIFV